MSIEPNKEKAKEWFIKAKKKGATHLLIVRNNRERKRFPVYVIKPMNVRRIKGEYDANDDLYTIVEIYDMSISRKEQLKEIRAWNYQKHALKLPRESEG